MLILRSQPTEITYLFTMEQCVYGASMLTSVKTKNPPTPKKTDTGRAGVSYAALEKLQKRRVKTTKENLYHSVCIQNILIVK